MKKKITMRCILGFPIGIALGYIITIFSSLGWANGYYSPCVPELISVMGSEINAVILQTLLCGIIGSIFAASSVIWEIEHWSLVKQSGIYFLIILLTFIPIAYYMHWMEHSVKGVLSYLGIFVLIYIIIWVIQYVVGKKNVKEMNEGLNKKK